MTRTTTTLSTFRTIEFGIVFWRFIFSLLFFLEKPTSDMCTLYSPHNWQFYVRPEWNNKREKKRIRHLNGIWIRCMVAFANQMNTAKHSDWKHKCQSVWYCLCRGVGMGVECVRSQQNKITLHTHSNSILIRAGHAWWVGRILRNNISQQSVNYTKAAIMEFTIIWNLKWKAQEALAADTKNKYMWNTWWRWSLVRVVAADPL